MFTEIKKYGNWNLSINEDKTEIMLDNGYSVCYAYYDDKKQVLFYDRIIAPKGVQTKTLSFAKNNMVSIY